jgi:hypothetical protein
MAGRNGSLRGQTIKLNVKFLNAAGNLTDPDSSPTIDIFPAGKDPNSGSTTDLDAVILDASQTSLGNPAGTNYVVRDSIGCYSYEFLVPLSGDIGVWFDRWNAVIDAQPVEAVFMFAIVGGGSIGTSQLFENNRVTVTIDSSLLDTDNHELGQDYEWYFTTTYSPLYSSVRKLRLELGPLVNQIPDDTINLAIFEASLLADAISFTSETSNAGYFEVARREYVTCLAGAMLLSNKGTQGKTKRLADLTVELSGDPNDKLKDLQACIGKWDHVIKSRGELATGTSLKPQGVVKGAFDPDRPVIGRLWTQWCHLLGNDIPAANTKIIKPGSRRAKKTFTNPRWNKSRWDDN